MPEILIRDLLEKLLKMGYQIEKTSKGHYKVYWENKLEATLSASHGKGKKKGVLPPYQWSIGTRLLNRKG